MATLCSWNSRATSRQTECKTGPRSGGLESLSRLSTSCLFEVRHNYNRSTIIPLLNSRSLFTQSSVYNKPILVQFHLQVLRFILHPGVSPASPALDRHGAGSYCSPEVSSRPSRRARSKFCNKWPSPTVARVMCLRNLLGSLLEWTGCSGIFRWGQSSRLGMHW